MFGIANCDTKILINFMTDKIKCLGDSDSQSNYPICRIMIGFREDGKRDGKNVSLETEPPTPSTRQPDEMFKQEHKCNNLTLSFPNGNEMLYKREVYTTNEYNKYPTPENNNQSTYTYNCQNLTCKGKDIDDKFLDKKFLYADFELKNKDDCKINIKEGGNPNMVINNLLMI